MLEKSIKANKLNKRIVPQLKKIVTQKEYGELTEMLIEILLRRQKEFELDDYIILNEAKNMVEHLPKIQVLLKKDLDDSKCFALCGRNGIQISYEFLKKMVECGNMERIYQTLTHEVYHSISMTVDTTGIMTAKKYRGLNEALNEVAATRACLNVNSTDKNYGYRLTYGYDSLTFISQALALSIGISERQLLKSGISIDGYKELTDLVKNHGLQIGNCKDDSLLSIILEKAFGKDMDKRHIFYIHAIAQQIEVMHDCDYVTGGNNMSKDKRNTRRTNAMKQLSKILFRYMSQQIDRDKREVTPEIVGEYGTRYNQLCAILEDRQREYLGDVNIFEDKDVQKQMHSLAVKIIYHSLGDKEGMIIIRKLQEQGMDCVQFFRNLPYKDENYYYQILLEDFDEDFVWDNSAVETFMSDWCTREFERFELSLSTPEIPTSVPKALSSVIDGSKSSIRIGPINGIAEEVTNNETGKSSESRKIGSGRNV